MIARGRGSLPAAIACLALLALPLAGCGDDGGEKSGTGRAGDGGPAKKVVTVNIASFRFTPDPIKVKAGGSVTWVNQDKAPHTAETDDAVKSGFDTDRLDLGDKKTIKVEGAGRFEYFCVYHRFMTGTVEVVE